MSVHNAHADRSTATTNNYDPLDDPDADIPRQAKEDALDAIEYQLLLEGARELDDYYGQQARFCILLAGRLGMRKGEITHLREEWVDWRRNWIEIPRHVPCDKGRDGGRCGDCRQKARQKVDSGTHDDLETALAYRWEPKTDAAARIVPFDFDPRSQLCVERFFNRYDRWPLSYQTVTRRVKAAARTAETIDAERTYPHCLRATAASYHADRELDKLPLKAMMGWVSLDTAQSYIAESGHRTARALREAHAQ